MIPRMKTHIRKGLLMTTVTLTDKDGRTCTTTMDRDVQSGDERIQRLKCRHHHVPFSK